MKRCDKMVEVGRRQFLRGGFAVGGSAIPVVGMAATEAKAATNGALLDYPSSRLGNVKDLKVNEPMDVAYPDADAPGVLLKLGKAVEGGAGPDGDIVGFSTVCPHKGFPLSLQRREPHAELPRPLLGLRLRSGRPADLGAGHAEPAAIHAARR